MVGCQPVQEEGYSFLRKTTSGIHQKNPRTFATFGADSPCSRCYLASYPGPFGEGPGYEARCYLEGMSPFMNNSSDNEAKKLFLSCNLHS